MARSTRDTKGVREGVSGSSASRQRVSQRSRATPRGSEHDPNIVDLTDTLFDSMADDAYVAVWRRDDNNKKMIFQPFKLGPEEATEERIAELRGGGYYQVRLKYRDPNTGRMTWGASRVVEIDGPPKAYVPPPEPQQPQAQQPQVQQPHTEGLHAGTDIINAGILDLFRMSREAQQMQLMLFKEMPESRREQPTLLSQVTPEMITAVASLWGAVRQERIDPLTMIEQVTNLVRSNANPTAAMKDILETVNDVFDIKDRVAPPKDDDPMMALLGENFSKLVDVISTATKDKGRTPTQAEVVKLYQQRHPEALPTGAPQQAGAQPMPDPNLPVWQKLIARYERQLLWAATNDKDAGAMATFSLQMLAPPARAGMREFLAHGEDAMIALFGTFPKLAEHRQWVTEFFAAMFEEFFGEDVEDTDVEEAEDDISEGQTDVEESDGAPQN